MTDSISGSRISGFHRLPPAERLAIVKRFAGLDPSTVARLAEPVLEPEVADHMIENMVSAISVPIGVATNVKVDGRDVLVPTTPGPSQTAQLGRSRRQAGRLGSS